MMPLLFRSQDRKACNCCCSCPRRPSELENFLLSGVNVIGFFSLFLYVLVKLWLILPWLLYRGFLQARSINKPLKYLLGVSLVLILALTVFHIILSGFSRQVSVEEPVNYHQLGEKYARHWKETFDKAGPLTSKEDINTPKKPVPVELKSVVTAPLHPISSTQKKLFTVTISQGRQTVFRTNAQVVLPECKGNPPLLMTLDPILVTDYK